MNIHQYENLLKQNSLLYVKSTLHNTANSFIRNPHGSIYFGCGLTTPKAPTVAVPFDILMFVLSSGLLHKQLHLDKIHCLLADTHALTNSFCYSEHIKKMLDVYLRTFDVFAQITGIDIIVHPASSFDNHPEYLDLLRSLNDISNPYVQRELADMLWFHQNHNVRLKLGWLIRENEKKSGRDERYFDSAFLERCSHDISFAYTHPGRTFDSQRPYVSPYVQTACENRISIWPKTDVKKMLHSNICFTKKEVYLSQVINLWNMISKVKVNTDDPLPKQVQSIINLLSIYLQHEVE